MARLTDYFDRRIVLAQEEVESWKKDHEAAEHVWVLEALFKDMLSMVDEMAEFDTKVNLEAATTGDVARLDAWDKGYQNLAGKQLKLFANFKRAADAVDAYSYKDAKIERGVLETYEKRLWGVVNPSDGYLERGDVSDAIGRSEEEARGGQFRSDRVQADRLRIDGI